MTHHTKIHSHKPKRRFHVASAPRTLQACNISVGRSFPDKRVNEPKQGKWLARLFLFGIGTLVADPSKSTRLINLVDRFEFLEGRVSYGQAYFDTVVLLSLLDPAINSVPFALSAGAAAK